MDFLNSPFWATPFNPVLPTSFPDDLTYYEFVKKIFYHYRKLQSETKEAFCTLNGLIGQNTEEILRLRQIILTHNDTLLALAKQYTDSRVKNLSLRVDGVEQEARQRSEGYFRALQAQVKDSHTKLLAAITANFQAMQAMSETINGKLEPLRQELKQYTDTKFGKLSDAMELHKAEVDAEIALMKSKLEEFGLGLSNYETRFIALRANLTTYINEHTQEEVSRALEELKGMVAQMNGDAILITSPVSGKTETLRKTLQEIYGGLWWGKITADEYASMKLTADEYRRKKVTALDYDTRARFIFFEELYMRPHIMAWQETAKMLEAEIDGVRRSLIMRDPTTGLMSHVTVVLKNAVDKLHSEFKLTADEYAALNLTAEEYAANQLTSFEYDFYAKKYLTVK